jgi:hypothetical protein
LKVLQKNKGKMKWCLEKSIISIEPLIRKLNSY